MRDPAARLARAVAKSLLALAAVAAPSACRGGGPSPAVPRDAAADEAEAGSTEHPRADAPPTSDAAPARLPEAGPGGGGGAGNGEEAAPGPAAAPGETGFADLDPGNDTGIGPPAPIPDCERRLRAAGAEFATGRPLGGRAGRDGPECGSAQPIEFRRGPGGIRWSPVALVDCRLALALARLETIVQEEAERWLGSRVALIRQGGTYQCRRIARFQGLMSEHAYANAIDVRSFSLQDGRTVDVERHFGAPADEPSTPQSGFLRHLARRLYDEDVFSCVLTPYWDALHRDHFHLDLARYRVDGTR